MFGLVVSPGYVPDAAEVERLHPRYLRSILYRVSDIERIATLGPPMIATVNNECAEVGGDWSGWDDAMQQIAELPTPPYAVCVGNEFDLFWQDDHANVPPEFAADLVRRASTILRPAGIKVVATGVASAVWPEYLQRMADLCRDEADWFDFHPYGQKPYYWRAGPWMFGDLWDALTLARQIAGKPVICSEYGVKISEAGSEVEVAGFLEGAVRTVREIGADTCPLVCWFAWRDQIGTPAEQGRQAFGLLSDGDRRRPAWDAFAALEDDVEDPQFVLGFEEWHNENPELIGDPVENEAGGVPGMSQQLTTNGLLTWANIAEGQAMTFYEFGTQIRHVRGAA